MISRLLVEDPASGTDVSRQTEARLLIYAFQDGFGEEKMRNLLADFRTVKRLLNRPAEIERLAGTVPTSGNQQRTNVPQQLHATIGAFLDLNQKEVRPFLPEISAVRRMLPGIKLNDADLLEAIKREASANGFTTEAEFLRPEGLGSSIDRWENEGGAQEEGPHSQAHLNRSVDPANAPQLAGQVIRRGSGRITDGEILRPAGQSV